MVKVENENKKLTLISYLNEKCKLTKNQSSLQNKMAILLLKINYKRVINDLFLFLTKLQHIFALV